MAPSLLFSQNATPPYPNMTAPPKHSLPRDIPVTHFSSPGLIAVDHWRSQQQSRPSIIRRIPRIMSTPHNTNSFVPDVGGHHEYTFETHPPHDDFSDNSMWSLPYLPHLQMQTTPQPSMRQSHLTPSPTYSDWSALSDNLSSPNYMLSSFSPEPHNMAPSVLSHVSPGGSDQALSPLYPPSPGLPSPSTPGSVPHTFRPSASPNMNNMLLLDPQGGSVNANVYDTASRTHDNSPSPRQSGHKGYTHREQLQLFREACKLPMPNAGPFLPQQMYKPHTTSDRKRYVEEVMLEPPLQFITEHPEQFGILLKDVLHSRTKRLVNRDQVVFEGRGPSVSIRLEWPGYRQWSRQIPTKDFRSPPQPITLAKLAKNVAKCVQRFMAEAKSLPMDEDTTDPQWKIGSGNYEIKFEDLVLVSIHHVSLGSWQPQLRLAHPMRPRPNHHQQQQQHVQYLPPTPRTASNASPQPYPSLLFPQLS